MSNNIDLLMSQDPLSLSAQDIDQIIAYQRKARASAESGVKVKKGDAAPKVDLVAQGLVRKSNFQKRKI